MEYIELGKITKIKTGKLDANASSENGKYPFFTCSKDPLKIDTYSYDCECVLVAGNGDLNVKYYNGKFDAYQRTYIIEILDKNKFDTRYIYLLLNSYLNELRRKSIGGVIKYIKLGDLITIKVPYIVLGDQRKIVSKLFKIENMINQKDTQINMLDLLIKSQFVEMFGEPFINNKKWKNGTINDLIIDAKYGTSRPSINGGKYKYLRMNNITYDGKLDIKDLKYIDIPDNELDKCTTKRGDILFNRTNSRDLVGKTCVYNLDEKMVIAGFIVRVRTNQLANPYFISAYLNTSLLKEKLYSMCKNASGQSNINAQELKRIEIYIPPMELQNKFAQIVEQIDKQKFEFENSLKKLKEMQAALMQEYFD